VVIAPERFAPGMALQLERLREALAGGMPRRGWKVGINVPEVLGRLDLPHPGVAWLDGRRVFPTGAELELRREARLHVEPEVAIRLSEAIPPRCSASIARARIASLHPALEIVDYGKPGSGFDEVVAHCMFHHATILGAPAPLEALRDLGGRWPDLRVGLDRAAAPRSDLVAPDFGDLIAFVADYLAAFGESLEPGDLVLSGSYLAKAAPLEPGEDAVADFGDLGTVSVRLAAAPLGPSA
jgi:2-keto-4-pentenoate hydratase